MKKIWITWENQRRNYTLSKAFGAKYYKLDYEQPFIIRYLLSLIKTLLIFLKEKPDIIFVQNPSIVLSIFSVIFGKINRIPIIVDAHNAGIFPFEGNKKWINIITSFIVQYSSITIVTNEILARQVESWGGKSFVLQDPIPDFEYVVKKRILKGKKNIFFICTYSNDEPYKEVIKAAKYFDNDMYLYISGNLQGKEKEIKALATKNVILTGYLPEREYTSYLYSADVVIDLTTRNNCLVCGAYEAVALGKPLITSDTEVLRNYFSKGTLYTDNTHNDLVKKINIAIKQNDKLVKEMSEEKEAIMKKWNKRKNEFSNLLNILHL